MKSWREKIINPWQELIKGDKLREHMFPVYALDGTECRIPDECHKMACDLISLWDITCRGDTNFQWVRLASVPFYAHPDDDTPCICMSILASRLDTCGISERRIEWVK